MIDICGKLAEIRALVEDGSPAAAALDALIAEKCGGGVSTNSEESGGGPNSPPG